MIKYVLNQIIQLMFTIKKNYNRDILDIPTNINCDAGTEFHGETKKYFDDFNINVKYADPNRHRQQGIVESAN